MVLKEIVQEESREGEQTADQNQQQRQRHKTGE
jgi:hypothetical protein